MWRSAQRTGLLAAWLLAACAGAATPREPIAVPFDDPLHLILVEARIGDRGPFRFLLDSGAPSSVVDGELAREIGLDTGAATTRGGTADGSRVTVAPVRGGVDFRLAPGLEIHVDQVLAAPFAEASRLMIGEEIHGILGSALFFQYVIEVDYAARRLVFHPPDGYRADGSGHSLELDFPRQMPRLPFIRATIVNGERRLADFPILVDSGGGTMGTAGLSDRAQWDALVTPANRIVEALGATGLSDDAEGTTHEAFVTRMERFVIGPFEFTDPLISYSAGGPKIAVMGASLLHRFTAVFDYSRRRLILEPNAGLDAPPLVDRSGVFLLLSPGGEGGFEVGFVAAGTPAAEAGLARGDVIRAIDGVPAREIPLNDARAMLCRPATYRLAVERDGEERAAVLATRSLFDG